MGNSQGPLVGGEKHRNALLRINCSCLGLKGGGEGMFPDVVKACDISPVPPLVGNRHFSRDALRIVGFHYVLLSYIFL